MMFYNGTQRRYRHADSSSFYDDVSVVFSDHRNITLRMGRPLLLGRFK